MDERRAHERYPVVVGSDIDANDVDTMFGLTQDVSQGGARLLTIARYTEGTRLRLHIHLDKDNVTTIIALVKRGGPIAERGMWRYEIGVQFDEQLSQDLVDTLRHLSAKLGL
jgi:hypothetical protein